MCRKALVEFGGRGGRELTFSPKKIQGICVWLVIGTMQKRGRREGELNKDTS